MAVAEKRRSFAVVAKRAVERQVADLTDTAYDHFQLEDTRVTRRYFGKFEAIIGHLGRVAATLEAENRLSKRDVEVMTRYIVGLNYTFKALAHKYHFS